MPSIHNAPSGIATWMLVGRRRQSSTASHRSLPPMRLPQRRQTEARCSASSYVLGIEHSDQLFLQIWVEMYRRSHDLSTLRLVFIATERTGSGAAWETRATSAVATSWTSVTTLIT